MRDKKNRLTSYLVLLGPAAILYASIIIFPVIYSLSLSFNEWSGYGAPTFVGLSNYINMFKDPVFWHGLRNNLYIVGVSIFGQIPLGFVLAYIIYRRMVKGSAFFEAMIFLPITISAVIVAVLWSNIFSPNGIVTALARIIQDDPRFVFKIFTDKHLAIMPILFVLLWMHTGSYMIIFLANLQKISPSLIEAALIDGATEGQILRQIILPMMLNIIFTTSVFAIAGSLKSFDLIFSMTGGGPGHYTEVVAIYMYFNTLKYYRYGFGSAISIFMVLLSVGLISLLRFIVSRFEKKYA